MFRKIAAVIALLGLAACGGGESGGNSGGGITGAGATFPAPIYSKWAEAYQKAGNPALNYQAIGSGGGIKQIKVGTVDFGASDKPMSEADLKEAGLYQFPAIIGGVVPVVNVPGVQPYQLRLSGALLAEIFLGKVKQWNAPEIAAINPGVALPKLPITVVHRSDGSGTSFLYTSYLTKVSPAWAKDVGANDAVNWPTGLGGKGNDGVAAFVRQTAGSIGYVEYAYAKQNGLSAVQMQNSTGAFLRPSAESFAAAAEGAPWATTPGNAVLLIDQPGANAWPITGASFVILYRNPKNPDSAANVLKFYDWAFRNGDQAAAELDFVPLPQAVEEQLRQQWATAVTANGKPVYQPQP